MNVNFSQIFQNLVDINGDKEALVNVERNRRYTFSQLHRLTNQISNMLREKLDFGQGDYAFSILHNDNLSLLHLWTSFKGEGVFAWTNFNDSLEQHGWQVALIKPKVVFIENALLDTHIDLLRAQGAIIICMDPVPADIKGVLYFWELLEGVSDENPDIERDDRNDVALLRFTGGTTGKGKCAEYTIDNWLATRDIHSVLDDDNFHAQTRFLHATPISHGGALLIMPTFFRGGCTVTINQCDLSHWCRQVEQERITMAFMVPTILYRLLEMQEAKEHDLSTLDCILYGAAPMAPAKLGLLQQRFGNVFGQIYGATENVSVIAYLDKKSHSIVGAESEQRLASCGKPTPGSELLIMDEQGALAKRGEKGEVWIRSRSTIKGYFNNAVATREEFERGFWKSGDIGMIDAEGYLHIVDRKKDMIISGGFNVYATEIEAAISGHPAVLMSAVVGQPHEEWGEAVHAEVILKEGEQCTGEALIDYVKNRVGAYKAPKTVTFVNELPLSSAGKVLRRQVREKYWQDNNRQIG